MNKQDNLWFWICMLAILAGAVVMAYGAGR